MKKIMFNDRFGLTDAVLKGRKTVTRRLINKFPNDSTNEEYLKYCLSLKKPPYEVGEIVAVAQSYENAGYKEDKIFYRSVPEVGGYKKELAISQNGWNNKMFVSSNLMPHQIRITGVRAERLQDITDEDCLREGIWEAINVGLSGVAYWYSGLTNSTHRTPRETYASLIDKISGKGTWNTNPYCWVINFELIHD